MFIEKVFTEGAFTNSHHALCISFTTEFRTLAMALQKSTPPFQWANYFVNKGGVNYSILQTKSAFDIYTLLKNAPASPNKKPFDSPSAPKYDIDENIEKILMTTSQLEKYTMDFVTKVEVPNCGIYSFHSKPSLRYLDEDRKKHLTEFRPCDQSFFSIGLDPYTYVAMEKRSMFYHVGYIVEINISQMSLRGTWKQESEKKYIDNGGDEYKWFWPVKHPEGQDVDIEGSEEERYQDSEDEDVDRFEYHKWVADMLSRNTSITHLRLTHGVGNQYELFYEGVLASKSL
ncbi:hypothetical protein DFA_11587 [Cavenderia fasciculata]|uniref:Uncharacterized protein n=1 Tax=Cavenderia fasciculata TaxID=261658 RepID=F4QDM9_CACFS|nr:uncharacterized protein DFA_11587 [Cavenderia fasciculata]EGG13826.1 hypothetical protein DFA_11587 [Cavenderia fasciculata]|eukprot:XP_004350534.1 hypothetical protein DFA_11587 [Cavenderia fasciculata]